MTSETYNNRFSGIGRLYGQQAMDVIRAMHVCIVGLGGVGSWKEEGLARSGIAKITLADGDNTSRRNTTRPNHTAESSSGRIEIATTKSVTGAFRLKRV